jgi:hypothetical protein
LNMAIKNQDWDERFNWICRQRWQAFWRERASPCCVFFVAESAFFVAESVCFLLLRVRFLLLRACVFFVAESVCFFCCWECGVSGAGKEWAQLLDGSIID